jgi:hypothetical protein
VNKESLCAWVCKTEPTSDKTRSSMFFFI